MSREKIYKKCPRCGEKTYASAKVCDNCKLIFSRLEYSSNKEAKKCIRQGEKEKVIYSTEFPRDLNRWKCFFLCLLFGFLGVHNVYMGRYIKGFFSMFFTIMTAILITLVNGTLFATLYSSIFMLPGALVFIFWAYDLFMLGINKYKVPIALDMEIKGITNGK